MTLASVPNILLAFALIIVIGVAAGCIAVWLDRKADETFKGWDDE
jgi:hypothetical protein